MLNVAYPGDILCIFVADSSYKDVFIGPRMKIRNVN